MKTVTHPSQRLRLGDNDLVLTLDSETQRLLKYQEIIGRKGSAVNKVDAAFFSERNSVQVCTVGDDVIMQ
jgi:hypothetical protein